MCIRDSHYTMDKMPGTDFANKSYQTVVTKKKKDTDYSSAKCKKLTYHACMLDSVLSLPT